MATYGWGTDDPVGDALYREGYRFDFFQAVRLLETMRPDAPPVGEGAEPTREAVRFKSSVGLGFPASDVAAVAPAANGAGPGVMQVNFMGLAGLLGPLPAPYTERILDRVRQQDTALRDFLDIFNHRLVSLLYRVRKHHRIGFAPGPPEASRFADYLFALTGLGTPGLRHRMGVPDRVLLRYAGLLARQPRSAAGLEALLADYFHAPVRVRQFTGGWHALDDDQTSRLGASGRNRRLGADVVLGHRVWQQHAGFGLDLGPLALDAFLGFLPDGRAHHALCELTRFYTNDAFDFGLRLRLRPGDVPESRLGVLGGARLGHVSWLRSRPPQAEGYEIRLRPRSLPPELEKLRLPLLADFSPAALFDVREAMQRHVLPEGRAVVRQDDPIRSIFVVVTGSVDVMRAEAVEGKAVLATLKEGDTFGNVALEGQGTYQAAFVTVEPSVVLELTRGGLQEVMDKHPRVARAVEAYRRRMGQGAPWTAQGVALAERLRLVGPFGGLPEEERYALGEGLHVLGLRPGTVVVRRGSPVGSFYVVARGRLRRERVRPDGTAGPPDALGPGAAFGARTLLYGLPAAATVTAAEQTELFVLTRTHARRVVARYPAVEHVLRVLSHEAAGDAPLPAAP